MKLSYELDTRGIDRKRINFARLNAVVRGFAFTVEANAKASLLGPRSGNIYERGTKTHRASAPGEPPATDTNNLRENIASRPVSASVWEVFVRDEASYGIALELGAPSRKLARRPFMEPALRAVGPAFQAAIKRIVEAAR